jgi:putative drug exporter of the RND superfamily
MVTGQAAETASTPRGPANLPGGRITKWIMIVLWLAVAFGAMTLGSKLSQVERNDPISWLPHSAESTEVAQLEGRFPNGQVTTAVVVYARASGLTDADRAKVAADRAAVGDLAVSPVPPPTTSGDGKAMVLTIPLSNNDDTVSDQAKQVRRTVAADLPAGLDAKLTGPAGTKLDASDAFSHLDKTLALIAAAVVAVLLLITYRSPILWLLPLITAGIAIQLANAVIYLLGKHTSMIVTSTNASMITVLIFGAGTDYALLLLARYREELRRESDRHRAMAVAIRRAGPAIIASAATVMLGLACFLVADMNSNRWLGPVAAVGIACALLAMLTLLPALLVVFGRWIFWPAVPREGSADPTHRTVWRRVGDAVARHPRPVWVVSILVLAALATGALNLKSGLDYRHSYTSKPDSVAGQELLSAHFPAGVSRPVQVVANASASDAVSAAVRGTDGIAQVRPPVSSTDGALVSISAVLADPPDSNAAVATVDRVRQAVHAVSGADAIVGGSTATNADQAVSQAHDRRVVIPLVLAAVLIVLMVLLRSLVAPLVLIATVSASFFAALGASWLLFQHAFGFPAADISLVLLGFVFLVTLGVDYNIFLMSRAREEVAKHGHREGVVYALGVTGGVISSAGIVLAATFSVLAVLPLVTLIEIGVLVALGVLLDTFLVRSVLVPALALDMGHAFWWPGRPARRDRGRPSPDRESVPVA